MIEIKWSNRAIQELDNILDYWLKRNKSKAYPDKIVRASIVALEFIKKHPQIGVNTDHRNVKMRLILNRFYLVYRFNNTEIEVLKFWDCRQDPKSNQYI